MTKRRRSISESLQLAIGRLWSGRIEFFEDDTSPQCIGEIVFAEGRIAWARASGQQETLGTFLWRLGRVTRDQLVLIQRRYRAEGGKKRLGALLEEAGFMSRPVLRRALMLHTRSAISRILSASETTAVMTGGALGTDESILFGPEEVLPPGWAEDATSELSRVEQTEIADWQERTGENGILTGFAQLAGYRAAGVVSSQGDVLAAHVEAEGLEFRALAVSVAAMFEASTRAVGGTALGAVNFVLLDCTDGGLTARWIDEHRTHFVFVLQESSDSQAMARFVLKGLMEQLRVWLAARMDPDQRSGELENSPGVAERYATDPFWQLPTFKPKTPPTG